MLWVPPVGLHLPCRGRRIGAPSPPGTMRRNTSAWPGRHCHVPRARHKGADCPCPSAASLPLSEAASVRSCHHPTLVKAPPHRPLPRRATALIPFVPRRSPLIAPPAPQQSCASPPPRPSSTARLASPHRHSDSSSPKSPSPPFSKPCHAAASSLPSAAVLTSFPPRRPSPSRSQPEREPKPPSSSEPVSSRPPPPPPHAAPRCLLLQRCFQTRAASLRCCAVVPV
jgi:hypothetical protein